MTDQKRARGRGAQELGLRALGRVHPLDRKGILFTFPTVVVVYFFLLKRTYRKFHIT